MYKSEMIPMNAEGQISELFSTLALMYTYFIASISIFQSCLSFILVRTEHASTKSTLLRVSILLQAIILALNIWIFISKSHIYNQESYYTTFISFSYSVIDFIVIIALYYFKNPQKSTPQQSNKKKK
ncbi:hypothetical protein DLAC_05749 [Tieghemostelium lacteum]|uniref:Transmembrane protein n=1 Tax=Tieghemostelium lacteum TaxID=361077 RepID=A0A151ZGY4_TIELA|nr:hypothetical protein DLAC_05749 [Tieghemostelium lacteum]|eukprot:KYQ93124.1 hypothetical protein DLAC_05749 [Tieghemostelium lacteum]